jgi:putative component of toxin-antitoxin plasmid stabilization module
VKGVGAGVYEYKIDFGPGYRIYFGKDGDRIIILLGGSDKKGPSRRDPQRSSGVGPIQEAEDQAGNELSDGDKNGVN